MSKGKVDLPAGLHAVATNPAIPAIPAVLQARHPMTGEVQFKLLPPTGGHAMLDLYFCGFCRGVLHLTGDEATNEELDRITRTAWRLAISAVRTRPDTGPVPAGVPLEGV